jgi:hypothetical protein
MKFENVLGKEQTGVGLNITSTLPPSLPSFEQGE